MNHNFFEKTILLKDLIRLNNFSRFNLKLEHISTYKICRKCNIEIFIVNNDFEIFLLNNEEIYNELAELQEIPLSCEELLIKSVIE